MTITSDHAAGLGTAPAPDGAPGTTDIAWAERAYRRARSERGGLRGAFGARRLVHLGLGLLTVITIVAMVLLLTTPSTGPRPTPARVRPASGAVAPPFLHPSPFVLRTGPTSTR